MSYIVPTTANNIRVVKYDLKQLARDVLNITGNKKAYEEFYRKIDISVYNKELLKNALFQQTKPTGFLEKIRVGLYDLEQYIKIACLGYDYSNEMNDILENIKPRSNVNGTATVCDYGIPLWDDTTNERRQRNNNRLTIINSFRVYGIIGMFYAASARTYTTKNDVRDIKNKILDIYEQVIENDTTKIIINDVKQQLDKLKNDTLSVLASKEQNAYNVITEKLVRKYGSRLVSYQLYGELIKTEDQLNNYSEIIKGLNKSQVPHALNGEIEVIQV